MNTQIPYNFFDMDVVKMMDDETALIYLRILLKSFRDEQGRYIYQPRVAKFLSPKNLSLILNHNQEVIEKSLEKLVELNVFEIFEDYILINVIRDKRNRASKRYKLWRENVFKKDDYTCQICNTRGGYIEAHHIKEWSKYPKLRYEISNGVTLCEGCHNDIHYN